MKHGKRNALLATMIVASLAFTGCQNDASKGVSKTGVNENLNIKYEVNGDLSNKSLIITVDKIKVGYDEVKVYMQELKNNYDKQFGSAIWSYDLGGGKTFEDKAKDEIIDQIIQLKIMGLKAPDLSVKLTDDEKDDISQKAKEYLEGLSNDYIKENAITEDLITRVYSDNYLASKVFDVATNDVSCEVSDDESKQITTWQLFVQTSGKDKNGNQVNLSTDEKKAALKKAKKLLKEAKNTDDFYSFAEKNSDDVKVEYTFGKGEQSTEVETAAFDLKKGETSKLIECDDGYYIIHCVNDNNEDATATKKEEIIAKRQDEAFQKLYTKWSEDYKVAVNTQLWDKVTFVEEMKDASKNTGN